MSSAHAHTAAGSLFPDEIVTRQRPAVRHLKYWVSLITGLRPRKEKHVAPDYDGCAWRDSVERQILDDIAISQAKRALV